ncbi:MAG: MATE family efflux transporter, partial [Acidimicrobiia bacterium]
VLDPLLIFGLDWGLTGAAVATLVAQWVGAGWFLFLLMRRLGVSFAPSSARELLGLLKVGRDIVIRTTALLVTFTVATRVATAIGEVQVAAHQIAIQLLIFLALLIDSLAIAAQTLIARFIGEERIGDAWALSRRLLELGAIVGLALAVLLVATRSVVPAWFTSEVEVQEALKGIWLILALLQPLAALVYVWDGIVLGAADFGYLAGAMVVSMAAAVGLMALVVPLEWGLAGVWWSFGVLTIVRAVTLGWWHVRPRSALRPV